MLCYYQDALPQGATTSPAITNIIMYDFDEAVGTFCRDKGVAYTRYCDDMTFSGDFDPSPVIRKVRDELRRMGLFLNDRKTVVVRKGQKHSVTGIVVNEKMSVSRDYKKHLRQEMYYCMKYGVAAHLSCLRSEETEAHYLRRLLGRVNYVLSLEPENRQMKQYRAWLTEKQKL